MFNEKFGQAKHTVDADIEWLGTELSNLDKSFISIVDTQSELALIVPRHSIVSIKPALKVNNGVQN